MVVIEDYYHMTIMNENVELDETHKFNVNFLTTLGLLFVHLPLLDGLFRCTN
jgi:hypothetical protein